jgi:hypothetical protein
MADDFQSKIISGERDIDLKIIDTENSTYFFPLITVAGTK